MCDKYLIMESIDKLEENEIAELENYLKEYKHAHNIYIRILAVRMVKLGQTRTAVGKYIHNRVLDFSEKLKGGLFFFWYCG